MFGDEKAAKGDAPVSEGAAKPAQGDAAQPGGSEVQPEGEKPAVSVSAEETVPRAKYDALQKELRTERKKSARLTGQLSRVDAIDSKLADQQYSGEVREIDAAIQRGDISSEEGAKRKAGAEETRTNARMSSLRGMIEGDGVDLNKPELAGVKQLIDSRHPDAAEAAYKVIRTTIVVEEPEGEVEGGDKPPEKTHTAADIDAAKQAGAQEVMDKFHLADSDIHVPDGGGPVELAPGTPQIAAGLAAKREQRRRG
jgi:hypothetical protein